jgi:hypothetical protein
MKKPSAGCETRFIAAIWGAVEAALRSLAVEVTEAA